MFTKILNNRLVKWAENHNLQKEEQAGYRKNTLQLIKYLAYKRCVKNILQKRREDIMFFFIDVTKAFDTIPHDLLWYKLIASGVYEKLLKVLNSMYANLKSCVRTHSGVFSMYCRYTTGMYV